MKRHAAMPDSNDLQWVFQIVPEIGKLIEKHVPEASAYYKAKGTIKNQILKQSSL
jgi:hypothetical protein